MRGDSIMKIIKGFPSTSQQKVQLNVINIIKHAARNFGRQEIASRKEDGSMFRYTYRDAYERMQRLANALDRIGAKVGDRIGVLSWNTYRNYEIYFGLPGTGAVMLLLNLRLAPHELSYVINHAKARFIIVDESLLDTIEEIAPRCKTVKGYVLITDKKLSDIKTNLKPIFSYEEILGEAAPKYEWPHLDENSSYSGCYTTGTTGRPKGVYYSHRAEYLHALMYAANAGISVNDCVFQIVPMFHVLGWGTPQAATIAGAKLVFPGRYSLDELEELARIMVQEGVTVSNGAPAIFMPMLEYIRRMEEKPNLSGARFVSGATEPPMPMMRGYRDLTGADIIHSYGSTEAHAIVTINQTKPWLERELSEEGKWDLKRKQGYIVVGLDVKLVDSEGKELPHDGKSSGEILIRGPWVSGSYYNTPGSEVQFTEDGYWKSGDAGTIDEEGYLKITDRVKDLIKSGGEWISSVDMENEIIAHPATLDAAVVGVAHPKWEERPLALVVLRDEFREKVSGEEIREHLARKFAKWQLPDEVIFVDAIPKTSVGKIDKKIIREEYRGIYTSS
jgi:fatty-acyl-CoA synthase